MFYLDFIMQLLLLSAMSSSSCTKKVVLPELAEDDDAQTTTYCSASVIDTEQTSKQFADPGGASGSDLETEKTDSSRLSKSRSSCTTSSGRKAKRLAKFLAYNQAKAAAAGEEFVIKDPKERRAENMVYPVDPSAPPGGLAVRGSVAQTMTHTEIIDNIMGRAEVAKNSLQERIWHMQMMDYCFAPKFVASPQDPTTYGTTEHRYQVLREGWLWCTLCSKWSTDDHKRSQSHRDKVSEMATIDEMIGSTLSLRRFSLQPGLQGPLSQHAFKAYWGNNVETMPKLFMDRLKKWNQSRSAYAHPSVGVQAVQEDPRGQGHHQPWLCCSVLSRTGQVRCQ